MGRRGIVITTVLVLAACGGAGDADPPEEGVLGTDTASTVEDTPPETTEATAGGREPLADAPSIAGTAWEVTTLRTAEFGFTNVWDDSTVSLEFRDDGTLTGFGGCSDLTGTWSVAGDYLAEDPIAGLPEGQELAITAESAGDGGCDERFAEQEVDLLEDLAATDWWLQGSDGGLTLRSADAAILSAVPAG